MTSTPKLARLWVACLCADWCGTCASYRVDWRTLAAEHPQHRFVWVDIEDKADWLGDLEVENFPTLLIFGLDADEHPIVQFFGTMLPHIEHLARFLHSLEADSSPVSMLSSSPDVMALCHQISHHFAQHGAPHAQA